MQVLMQNMFHDCSSLTILFTFIKQENTAAAAAAVHRVVDVSADADNSSSNGGLVRGLTCRACSFAFATVNEQHAHFKSNLHLLNLR
jgi:hypothetical protein